MEKKIKKLSFLIIILLTFYSCIINGEFGVSDANINFIYMWDNERVRFNSELAYGNDTLKIDKLQFVISNILLIKKYDTVDTKKYQLINFEGYYSDGLCFKDVINDTYNIEFTFGISDINQDYNDLNAQNFNTTDNGYFFLKFDGTYQNANKTFNYHIVKTPTINYTNTHKVIIKDFYIGSGIYSDQKSIKINLKNLFTNRNLIDLEDLTPNIINDSIKHSKLVENTKNIFYY